MKDIDFNKAYKWLISNMKKYALFLWLGFSLGICGIDIFDIGWWVVIVGSSAIYQTQLYYLAKKAK